MSPKRRPTMADIAAEVARQPPRPPEPVVVDADLTPAAAAAAMSSVMEVRWESCGCGGAGKCRPVVFAGADLRALAAAGDPARQAATGRPPGWSCGSTKGRGGCTCTAISRGVT